VQKLCQLVSVAATTLQAEAEQVMVEVDKASRNARRLYAAVSIAAPLDQVWQSLTDYEGLGNFIPGAFAILPLGD